MKEQYKMQTAISHNNAIFPDLIMVLAAWDHWLTHCLLEGGYQHKAKEKICHSQDFNMTYTYSSLGTGKSCHHCTKYFLCYLGHMANNIFMNYLQQRLN